MGDDAMKRNIWFLTVLALCLLLVSCTGDKTASDTTPDGDELKLYWFIPDGMRADPELFNIFQWAEEGKLPNIKRMMEQGSYGYSIPVYPGHTPVNFATLLTGTLPKTHGVADGPMHVEGKPLDKVAVGGFSSVAKKVDPIWVTLEEEGKDVFLLSIPGSTPPELQKGTTVRGRWGGWGADFHATIFEEKSSRQFQQGRTARLFTFGPKLTQYIESSAPAGQWASPPASFSPAREIEISNYGATLYAYLYNTTDNGIADYDRALFSPDRSTKLADLGEGQWSGWLPITLAWTSGTESVPVETQFRIRVIKLGPEDFFRIRLLYSTLNSYIAQPQEIAGELIENVGPMVDFVDNWPQQLVYYDEDKAAFAEEMDMTLEWHRSAAEYILGEKKPDIFIQDTYTPNQMLESRWWLGSIDPASTRYAGASEEERERARQDVEAMYRKLDAILGVYLDNADENTYVVLSSDHGIVALNKKVYLNNLFAQKGWLKFTLNPETGEPLIDWQNSSVIYLKMDNVYVCPTGLAGNWTRCSGPDYEALRDEVIAALQGLEDPETGDRPLAAVMRWEDVEDYFDLPVDRVGDLIIANHAGYGWDEEMTSGGELFFPSLTAGYKQAILPDDTPSIWTPFIIMGPGVKRGNFIAEPSHLQDQYPTLMRLLNVTPPHEPDGRVLGEMLSSAERPSNPAVGRDA